MRSICMVVALGVLSSAQDHHLARGLHRGRGHGKKGSGIFSIAKGNCYWGADDSQPLFDRLQEECDTNYACGEVNTTKLDCSSWETVDGDDDFILEGCPEELTDEQKEELTAKMKEKREKWMAMTYEERQEYRTKKEEVRAANAVTVLGCGCCSELGTASVAELVKGKEGAVAKTLGFQRPRGDHHDEGGKHGDGHGYGGP